MKVLCDVHLSLRLVKFLTAQGVPAVHANHLANKSESTDAEIVAFADNNDYVVFTKDEDFRTSYLLRQRPRKLVHIRTENRLTDKTLVERIGQHLAEIQQLDSCASFYLEISADRLSVIVAA